jgi:hypothetical protein
MEKVKQIQLLPATEGRYTYVPVRGILDISRRVPLSLQIINNDLSFGSQYSTELGICFRLGLG